MAFFITENCVGCTACTSRCPTQAIHGERKSLHSVSAALCIDCGACGVVCPTEAIHDSQGIGRVMLKKQQRPRAFVDEASCTGCDKCAEHCPFDALHMQEGVDPVSPHFGVMRVEDSKCTGCHECEKACPYDAIFVFRKDQPPEWHKPQIAA